MRPEITVWKHPPRLLSPLKASIGSFMAPDGISHSGLLWPGPDRGGLPVERVFLVVDGIQYVPIRRGFMRHAIPLLAAVLTVAEA